MVKQRAFFALMLSATLAGSSSAALAARDSVTRPAAKSPIVTNYGQQFYGPMTALSFVGDRLIDVFRAVRGVGRVERSTVGSGYQTYGIQDGPDGVDPLGAKEGGPRTDGPVPVQRMPRVTLQSSLALSKADIVTGLPRVTVIG